jgi:L-malate glycosyltransferase
MANAPDAVFAVSEQVRQHCIHVDGIKPERVQTIYNGLSLSDWSLKPRPIKDPGEALVTTVGHIRRVKGHDVFIKAAGLIAPRFPGVSFSIAGDVLEPEYFGELVALVKELNLAGRFRFDGGVSNLREHLSGADIFVLPSRSEGFSNAIVEAMAASLPAVVTNVGGNAEAVDDEETGFVVPSDDPDALADAIVKLLSDPAKAKEMGAAGKRVAGEKFTIEAMIDQTTAAYNRLRAKG